MMTFWRVALLGALCIVAAGCASASRGPSGAAGSRAPATPVPSTAAPPAPARPSAAGVQTTGTASWYGDAHQGKTTASGEKYDMHALTAAHRTLPFGTRVRVTNV